MLWYFFAPVSFSALDTIVLVNFCSSEGRHFCKIFATCDVVFGWKKGSNQEKLFLVLSYSPRLRVRASSLASSLLSVASSLVLVASSITCSVSFNFFWKKKKILRRLHPFGSFAEQWLLRWKFISLKIFRYESRLVKPFRPKFSRKLQNLII